MRRTLSLAILLTSVVFASAQELTVREFRQDPTDISAVRYEMKDLNGQPCALLKIGLVLSDVSFEGPIVHSEYKDGEWWLYMPDGGWYLTVKSKKYLPLRYEFKPVEKKQTYILQIELPKSLPVGPSGEMEIRSNVKDADVYVDGQKVSSILPFTYSGPEGEHQFEIRASGYNTGKGRFQIQLRRKGQTILNLSAKGSFMTEGGNSYEMVLVPGGSFRMGSDSKKALSSEQPVHTVQMETFQIGRTEVTQALWEEIMGSNPSVRQGSHLPVENVSWYDVQDFIRRLNTTYGTDFCLPTEAQWEYAARSCGQQDGDDYAGGGSADRVAVRGLETQAPGTKSPNSLGLVDMSGNVAEWCSDWWSARYPDGVVFDTGGPEKGIRKVVRGAFIFRADKPYDPNPTYLRTASRGSLRPDDLSCTVGFRLATKNNNQ